MRNVLTSKLPKKKEEEEEKYHLDYIGEDGYVYKHNGEKYYKTGIFLQGPKGLPGVKGKDGLIPRIGKNGNWFIGDTDTFVKAALDTSLYATKKDLDDLIDNAPEVLNTLKELANAIGDDADFATNINNRLTDIENVAYQVPVGGIPESDLSQGVKDKMNEKEVFWATYGTTTAAEIDAAVAAGKQILCVNGGHIHTYAGKDNQYHYFFAIIGNISYRRLQLQISNNGWAFHNIGVQGTANKVSSWSATPDNTHYPSEKLVKESLDVKAGIGDVLFANFSNLTPKKTFEYDVSDTAYHPLFSRANTGISQLMSEVDDIVKFRITITGTNIYARVDVVVRFQPSLYYPSVMAWNDTLVAAAASSGLFYLRAIYPKNIDNGYDWVLEFNCYNATMRHVKVEIYEDTENITWTEEKVNTGYNATYQANSNLLIREHRGLCANLNWYLVESQVGNANSAVYLNTYLSTWISGAPPATGEALATHQLAIMSGQKVYKATNKNVPIDCDCGVMMIENNYAQGVNIGYVYAIQKLYWTNLTADPALTMDTFARGDQVYLRCTLGQDGKIYPDGHLSNVKSAGYTWVHIGTAASATAINLDTCGKPFITLNNDGKVTHINGTAVMDSSMAKWGVVSQTQTWTQASDGGYDYTMSNLQYGWIPQANIDLYEAAGAVFNEQSGYFELNGLVDISYEEMGKIYRRGSLPQSPNTWKQWAQASVERTFLPAISNTAYLGGSGEVLNFGNSALFESCVFHKSMNQNSLGISVGNSASYFLFNSIRLKVVKTIRFDSNTSTALTNAFKNCYSLEDVFIIGIKFNISFGDSARLKVDSILYMITNEASTSAITITLHPTAYARAIADSDVQAALQAHTNVSLASAT